VACAVALRAAREGKRTLLVEMDAKGSVAAALGIPPAGYEPAPARENLWVMSMDTENSLREYLRIHLRIPFVTRLGPLAATFDFVADAAPGVREVLAVGKVCWEVREGNYDLVVVDAEASGHVVAQISSPRTIKSLVPRGPLRDQTAWMLDILDDPERTGVLVVTTAEELPVTETVALAARLRAETRTDVVWVVANALEPGVGAGASVLAADPWFSGLCPEHARSAAASAARAAAQESCVAELVASVPGVPLVRVPLHDASGAALAALVGGDLP
jgi:anion-transporting  ArsA/GET3 family ATPase